LQIGYAVSTNREMISRIKGIGIRDTGEPDEPALRGTGSLALAAARVMLSPMVSYYVRNLVAYLQEVRDLTYKRLRAITWIRLNPLEGTYLIFPDMRASGMSSQEMTKYLLDRARIAVEPGSEFGPAGEGYTRINIGTSKNIIMEALNRMEEALKRLTIG